MYSIFLNGALMMQNIRISKMAELLCVTPQTVRKWAKQEQIAYHKTPGGMLYFTEDDVNKNIGYTPKPETPPQETWWYYVRSSSGSKEIKQTQIKQLQHAYPPADKIIQDNASGLSEKRSGLKRLFNAAEKHELTDLAITTRDRLTRFGYYYIERYLEQNGVIIHVLNEQDPRIKQPAQELMEDFMALIASFSGRFYQLRSIENQKRLLAYAEEALKNKTEDRNNEQEA